MEKKLYDEMVENTDKLNKELQISDRKLFLFGHCNATLELIDLLEIKGISVDAILDNSEEKQGIEYKGVVVVYPQQIMELAGDDQKEKSVVLITSRFYASMQQQLRRIGYRGPIRKVIDYNTYAEYSLSEDTITRMQKREQHGYEMLSELTETYPEHFRVFCPFNALGDIYFMISYWESFARNRGIHKTVFCVPSKVLVDVIRIFGDYTVAVYDQKDLDAMIQSVIYRRDKASFIAHQDRPYVINLSKALYIKKIPLETMYCCGVYGLPKDTKPMIPRDDLPVYKDINLIPEGKAVIFSPYAKSVTSIKSSIWVEAVKYYESAGYKCYTNIVGDEKPLERTEAISPSIMEMRSVVERAGTFIGIRSGLCDILREAKARKVALYPDYNYCDTKWKAIDIYYIDQFDYNLLATKEIEWDKL